MRPASLLAVAVSVVVGSVVAAAEGGFRPLAALGVLATVVFLVLGFQLAQELFAARQAAGDRGSSDARGEGLAGGWHEGQVWAATWLCFAIAAAASLYLAWVAGPILVLLELAALAAALASAAGALPLDRGRFGEGLGQALWFVLGGPIVVCVATYVQLLRLPANGWWAAAVVGAVAAVRLTLKQRSATR